MTTRRAVVNTVGRGMALSVQHLIIHGLLYCHAMGISARSKLKNQYFEVPLCLPILNHFTTLVNFWQRVDLQTRRFPTRRLLLLPLRRQLFPDAFAPLHERVVKCLPSLR